MYSIYSEELFAVDCNVEISAFPQRGALVRSCSIRLRGCSSIFNRAIPTAFSLPPSPDFPHRESARHIIWPTSLIRSFSRILSEAASLGTSSRSCVWGVLWSIIRCSQLSNSAGDSTENIWRNFNLWNCWNIRSICSSQYTACHSKTLWIWLGNSKRTSKQ